MNLDVSHVMCSSTDGDRHPWVGRGPGVSGACEICALRREIKSGRNVMKEVLDTLLEGKVVLAADGIRGWLACSSPLESKDP